MFLWIPSDSVAQSEITKGLYALYGGEMVLGGRDMNEGRVLIPVLFTEAQAFINQ